MYFTNGLGNGNNAPDGTFNHYGAGDLYDMDIDGDGNYILGGHTVPMNPDGSDGPSGWEGTAIKVSKATKQMMWLKTFGNPNDAPNPSIIYDECSTAWLHVVPWGGYALACGSGIEPPYPNGDSPFNTLLHIYQSGSGIRGINGWTTMETFCGTKPTAMVKPTTRLNTW